MTPPDADARPGLSVLIPVYNEIATVERQLAQVAHALPGVEKEIIIVDDGSTDGAREVLQHICGGSAGPMKLILHERNRGKGAAVRTATAAATGAVIVIQDADLEYDPADWAEMYALIAERKVADAVFGSRFYGRPHRSIYFHHYVGNRLITLLFNLLYNQTLTDIEACTKMFTRAVLQSLNLTAADFGTEIQLSAQIALNRNWRIYEMGIRYYGRTYAEGKKVGWVDGIKALWYLFRFRFVPGN
jgi:glycosyltransferase involved in cell wall biosynthesis